MGNPTFSGLLVRLPAGGGAALGPSLRTAADGFELEPLFTTVPPTRAAGALALAPDKGWEWFIARPKEDMKGANAWDLAHGRLVAGLGLSGEMPAFVEPDLCQEWPYENPGARDGQALAAAACVFNDQIGGLPQVSGRFAWHLDPRYSQLLDARRSIDPAGRTIRIAHLDTGFDPDHPTCPRRLNRELQRNFMDDQGPNDAHDPGARGLLKNPGHGTGTLSILAGNRFSFSGPGYAPFDDFVGGAPDAEIVPVRVGKSVVQIFTSSIASGINYAAELCAQEATCVHVISMSMGGVASQAWADAVNKAYDSGIVYVAAAGNNISAGFFGVPTRFIVYPARFRRVIAACGVMADTKPYYGLSFRTMQGNWGPTSKMATALSAFTPNVSWAEIGCQGIVDMDGQGTSAATPQVAAAAALYLQKHAADLFDPNQYPEAWMRVEAVRHALFSSADKSADGGSPDKLGNGIVQAESALALAPIPRDMLHRTPADNAAFSFLRALTGLGLVEADPAQRMIALEATQLTQQWDRMETPNPVENVVPDPDLPAESISPAQRRHFLEALLSHPNASKRLKQHVTGLLERTAPPSVPGGRTKDQKKTTRTTESAASAPAVAPRAEPRAAFLAPRPPFRRLRGFAVDPTLATALATAKVSQVTLAVPWEPLKPGPVGEYLEVIDFDPASRCYYEPVNLDDPRLLAQDGLAPSEGTPQFHQQMVYAVVSRTIQNFEHALGRKTLWRPGPAPERKSAKNDSVYVQRLRVYPHALRERNAYYTPQKIALLFGYFKASDDNPGDHMPGSLVFTCLSHDIVAHETTHALLDGMSRSFLQATNPDVLAFHEGFADIVAIFQHFTFPEILRHQISVTRGDIRSHQNFLGELAGQFGHGAGMREALRSAIGRTDAAGVWHPIRPDPKEYENTTEPHARGAILVAAVFDAFLSIYERRTSDLLRLATGGSGVLQAGAIHPDLVERLAEEAAKSAQHVLTMCIRALDYCPPVDITFGEFLRAIITADVDLVADDDLGYRVSFVEAFRRRGIYSSEIRTLGVESLVWRGPDNDESRPSQQLENGLAHLRAFAHENLYTDSREETFHLERGMRREIHRWLSSHFEASPLGRRDAEYLGLNPDLKKFEVRSARFAYRTSPDGGMVPQLLLGLLQEQEQPVDPSVPGGEQFSFAGGCTLVADLRRSRIRYCIRKNSRSQARLARQQQFAISARDKNPLYLEGSRLREEPFAALHRGL
jgi:subtilisin family serine protease